MAIGEPTVLYMLVPREIGEPYAPAVDNYAIHAYCSIHCRHANVTYGYLCLYCLCSHYYHSSVGHSYPAPGSPPHGIYGPSDFLTRVLYPVAPCRPLQPVTSMPGSYQRGVAQEK